MSEIVPLRKIASTDNVAGLTTCPHFLFITAIPREASFNPHACVKIYAILTPVNDTPQIWQTWANTLQRWGLQEITAIFLDAVRPLNLLGAQVVYLGQPIFRQLVANDHLEALAKILEDPTQTQAFISLLETTHRSD